MALNPLTMFGLLNPGTALTAIGLEKASNSAASSMPGRRVVELSPEEKALEDQLYKNSQLSEAELLSQARAGVPETQEMALGSIPQSLDRSGSQLGMASPDGFNEALNNMARRHSSADLSKMYEAQRLAAPEQRANRLSQSAGVVTSAQNLQMENAMRRAQALAAQQQARQQVLKGVLGAAGNIGGMAIARSGNQTPSYSQQSVSPNQRSYNAPKSRNYSSNPDDQYFY